MLALNAQPKRDPIIEIFLTQVPLVFELTELTLWKAIVSKWFNVVFTFSWSFMDLFVIIISVGLVSQLKRINSDLQLMTGQVSVIKLNI